jgi:dicarboxylate transporter 10
MRSRQLSRFPFIFHVVGPILQSDIRNYPHALYKEVKKFGDDKATGAPMLAAMAALSGFCGALVGRPSDIANIRMQNDHSLSPMQRHNYQGVFDAWLQMKGTEGWAVLVQGL